MYSNRICGSTKSEPVEGLEHWNSNSIVHASKVWTDESLCLMLRDVDAEYKLG